MRAPDECWLWTGCVSDFGHGRMRANGRIERTHRIAYKLFVGPIPDGDVVRHTCDVPACWNPNHLILGSQLDNVHDAVVRGRHRTGWAKITAEDAVDIRERLAMGQPKREVAERWGLSEDHVRRIDKREVWKNAEGFDVDADTKLNYDETGTPF